MIGTRSGACAPKAAEMSTLRKREPGEEAVQLKPGRSGARKPIPAVAGAAASDFVEEMRGKGQAGNGPNTAAAAADDDDAP